jgi:adenine specific DNA methylase Mod
MPDFKRPWELGVGKTQDGSSKAPKRQIDPIPDEITPALKKYIAAKLYSFGVPQFFPRSIRLLQEIMQEVDRRFTGKDDNDDETADSEY